MASKQKAKSAPKTLANSAYDAIRRDIISGKLPAGQKLRLEMLCKRYEIGMSPLREALARLIGDNLVVTEGQRGFWVAGLSIEELDDLIMVRGMLEVEALQMSVTNGDKAWEKRLTKVFTELTEAEKHLDDSDDACLAKWEQLNSQFHSELISECRSPWMIRMLGSLVQQSERYRRISIDRSPPDRDVHEEHYAIYDAAINKEVLKTCRLIGVHLEQTASAVKAAFADIANNPKET